MHFRLGTPQDFAPCAALLTANNCFRLAPSIGIGFEPLWRRILERKLLANFVVWEDPSQPPEDRIGSFAMSVIVDDRFIERIKSAGVPWSANLLYQDAMAAASEGLLLDQQRVARANAGDGVNIFVLHNPMRVHRLADPRNHDLLTLGPNGFYFSHEGFYTKSVFWEVYGPEHAGYIAGGGYHPVHDYSASPAVAGVEPDRVPHLYALERDAVGEKSYLPHHLWLFSRKRPQMRFTPKQQQHLIYALLGQSDRELQVSLGISEDAVKQAWKNIMQRAAENQPARFSRDPDAGEGRGQTRRHTLLAYLRQHMEELRPYLYEKK